MENNKIDFKAVSSQQNQFLNNDKNISKVNTKTPGINPGSISYLSQTNSNKNKTQIRDSISTISFKKGTINTELNEISLNYSNLKANSNQKIDKTGSMVQSTNHPSFYTSNKNSEENQSTFTYSNQNFYKTVNNKINPEFKIDLYDKENEENKLKELIKSKDKIISTLTLEYDNIQDKSDQAKKTFQSNLSKFNNIKQSNEQLKKLICMMIVNKK